MVWSSTKGVVAVAAHMLAQEGLLEFDAAVVEYWPEFGAEGKERIAVRWLFSHRSGLAAIEQPLGLEDVIAWTPVVDALAAQRPLWEPARLPGYHTLPSGWWAAGAFGRGSGAAAGRMLAGGIERPPGVRFCS